MRIEKISSRKSPVVRDAASLLQKAEKRSEAGLFMAEGARLCEDAAKSGIEIAVEIIAETTRKEPQVEPLEHFGRSKEYWIGWAVAYYQWHSGRKYSEIFKGVSYEDLQQMYYTLHEADITKFVDIIDERMKECFPETNLKRIRTAYGCTQAELAQLSGVSLRSIQMYEQRNKDINKASVDTVYRLAKTLGCAMEDLIEK